MSTVFSSMDISRNDREYIYKHLGHSEQINKNVYQCPMAVKEITVVGKKLLDIDLNTNKDVETNELDINENEIDELDTDEDENGENNEDDDDFDVNGLQSKEKPQKKERNRLSRNETKFV